MPCHKTILNCFAFRTFESVLRHGIRLNFSSDNPAFRLKITPDRPTKILSVEAAAAWTQPKKNYLNSKPTQDFQYQVIEHDFYNLEKRN